MHDRAAANSMVDLVLVEPAREPGVGLVTLNRPEARNGLSLATLDALHAAIGGSATTRR